MTRFPALIASAVVLAGLTGCSGGLTEGRSDLVAEAGDRSLAPGDMVEWLARTPAAAPTPQDAEFFGLTWVDYTLLAEALAAGRDLTDESVAGPALAPDRMLLALRAWHDTLIARRPRVPASEADSLYAGDRVRVFQQILIPVQDPSDVRASSAAQAQAESLLTVIRNGADFAALVREHSTDRVADSLGFLPVVRRGGMPPEFERTAWQLEPGQLAGLGSRLGIHVVRRPELTEEVRGRLLAHAESLATRRADSLYTDSLRTGSGLAVSERAVPLLRAFFNVPADRSAGGETVATWQGGGLTLAQVITWIDVLPPASWLQLRGASDLMLEAFVRDLGQQYLLFAEAERAGITVTPAQLELLQNGYRAALRSSAALLGVYDTVPMPPGEAAARVAGYLDRLTSGTVAWRPLPSALGAVLRGESGYQLHRAGARAAALQASERRTQSRDSAGS